MSNEEQIQTPTQDAKRPIHKRLVRRFRQWLKRLHRNWKSQWYLRVAKDGEYTLSLDYEGKKEIHRRGFTKPGGIIEEVPPGTIVVYTDA